MPQKTQQKNKRVFCPIAQKLNLQEVPYFIIRLDDVVVPASVTESKKKTYIEKAQSKILHNRLKQSIASCRRQHNGCMKCWEYRQEIQHFIKCGHLIAPHIAALLLQYGLGLQMGELLAVLETAHNQFYMKQVFLPAGKYISKGEKKIIIREYKKKAKRRGILRIIKI